MKVTVTRSGGFLGAPMTYEIDTQSLSAQADQQLASLVESLPPGSQTENLAPDSFQYDVEVAQGEMARHWQFFGDPNPASPLIDFVKQHSEEPLS